VHQDSRVSSANQWFYISLDCLLAVSFDRQAGISWAPNDGRKVNRPAGTGAKGAERREMQDSDEMGI
jgi:hypothetical protein